MYPFRIFVTKHLLLHYMTRPYIEPTHGLYGTLAIWFTYTAMIKLNYHLVMMASHANDDMIFTVKNNNTTTRTNNKSSITVIRLVGVPW